jgi:hypothetical protein
MEAPTKCVITFNNKHQSENVVIGSEETIMAQSHEIVVVPSFTFN